MSSEGGVNSAMLASMEQAHGQQGHGPGGGGLPSNNGLEGKIGGDMTHGYAQQLNMDNNLAGVGGVNPIPIKGSFDNDFFSELFDGNMVPGNIQYAETFAVNNLAVGDVSMSSAFGPQKALNVQEGGHSFAGVGNITGR